MGPQANALVAPTAVSTNATASTETALILVNPPQLLVRILARPRDARGPRSVRSDLRAPLSLPAGRLGPGAVSRHDQTNAKDTRVARRPAPAAKNRTKLAPRRALVLPSLRGR